MKKYRQVSNCINFHFYHYQPTLVTFEGSKAAKSCAIMPLGHKMADFYSEVLAPLSCPADRGGICHLVSL